jgi:hypothetical protein
MPGRISQNFPPARNKRLTLHVIDTIFLNPKNNNHRPMSKNFFNTISIDGTGLTKAEARAAYQNVLIAAIFRANPEKRISPYQMQKILASRYGRNLLITSVRRSMTTLADRGTLTKCGKEHQVISPYGEKEYTWAYNEAGDTKALEGFLEDLQEGRLESREKCSEVSPQPEATIRTDSPAPKMFIQQALFAY